ncbi:MAG: MBL fold metallo-hydrolase [Nitrospirae bacterium]|nr:MAG: MBL fold metallo-hydrolase [Nitrospirota bacterium]
MSRTGFKKYRIVLLASLLVFSLSFISNSVWAAGAGLTKLAENVYSYADTKKSSPQNSFGANAGIIIGEKGVVVVDTLISAKESKRFVKDIKAVTNKPLKYVVNTHGHLDHTFGNAEFSKRGAVIAAHKNCLTNMKKNGEATLKNAKNFGLSEKDMKGTKIAYPSLTFGDRMEIDLGGQTIELIATGHSHSDDSVLVYLPDKKILFAGDVLFTGYHPYIGDGNITEWVKTIDRILAMDVDKIVPGHGPVSTKKDLEEMKNYLMAFDKKAKELCAASKDIKYIIDELKKNLPVRPEAEGLIQFSVMTKYLKAEAGK